MSRFNPERLQLQVTEGAATLYVRDWRKGWRRRARVELENSFRFSLEPLLEKLPLLFAEQDWHARLTIVLPDKAVRLFMVSPPTNISRFEDLKAIAALRLEALYGFSATGWKIDADWQSNGPFLACAMPLEVIHRLRDFVLGHGMTLVSLQPAFIQRWNEERHLLKKASAWLMSCGADRAFVAAVDAGRLVAVFSITTPQGWEGAPVKLRPSIEEALFRHQLTVPDTIYVAGSSPTDGEMTDIGLTKLAWCRGSLANVSSSENAAALRDTTDLGYEVKS